MSSIFKFTARYFIFTIILLLIEISIALFFHDTIIRPYIGDMLVVILIYCFLRTFFNVPVITTAIAVLLFSFAVETAQYFHLVNILGLEHSRAARVILGSSFSWMDILTYITGIAIVLAAESIFSEQSLRNA